MLGDEDLLVEVYGRLQRKSWAKWRDKVPRLLNLLEDDIPVSLSLLLGVDHTSDSCSGRGCTFEPCSLVCFSCWSCSMVMLRWGSHMWTQILLNLSLRSNVGHVSRVMLR